MTKWTQTQVVAACFWFNGQATVKSVAQYGDISEKEVQEIRSSDVYREEVKTLMLATRSSAKLEEWINTYLRQNVSTFSKRMGLEPDVVEALIEEVLTSLSMNNEDGGRNMFGNLTTQEWAREVFPILVNKAQNRQTTTFKKLAKHFGVRCYQIFGSVCGIISTTLYELEKEWDKGHIPRITNLVIRSDGKPSGYIASALTDEVVAAYEETQLKPIWEYQHWDVVQAAIECKGKDYNLGP